MPHPVIPPPALRAPEPSAGPDIVLARLAHGIRDTLHALGGHIDLLTAGPLGPHQRRHADAIRVRVAHLRELVDEALGSRGATTPSRPDGRVAGVVIDCGSTARRAMGVDDRDGEARDGELSESQPKDEVAMSRTITHVEFLYGAGERELAKELFAVLGCRVRDGGGVFFTAFVEPSEEDSSNNVFYASEATEEQQAFERELRAAAGDASTSFAQVRRAVPQRAFHCGFRVPDEAALDALIERVRTAASSGPLAGRIDLAGVYRPGEPGAIAPNMVQAFIWTDVVATGVLALGQIIEAQWHLTPAPS